MNKFKKGDIIELNPNAEINKNLNNKKDYGAIFIFDKYATSHIADQIYLESNSYMSKGPWYEERFMLSKKHYFKQELNLILEQANSSQERSE